MLADLEEGRVLRRLDEIAGRIDEVEAWLATPAVAGDQDGGVRRRPLHFYGAAIAALHGAHRLSHDLRDAVHGGTVEDRLHIRAERRILDGPAQPRLHPLGDRQIDRKSVV